MPSIITHHVFAKDLFEKMDNNTRSKVENEQDIYLAFAQSHDYLFYNLKKDIKNIGHFAHKHNTQKYLINIVKNIKKYNLEDNQQVVAYLYGSITHYVLDSMAHPYIFFIGGACNDDDPKTYKYRGEHTHIEKDLDALYFYKYYKKPFKYCNTSKDIIGNPKFNKELKFILDKTFLETYKINNISKYFTIGIRNAKLIHFFISNDRFGIKKFFLRLIELFSFNKLKYISSYSNYITNPNTEFLNNNKEIWCNPVNKDLVYNYSFDEIYDMSIKKCLNIIMHINSVLYSGKDLKILKKYIKDISYSNGLLIKDYKPMSFFKY